MPTTAEAGLPSYSFTSWQGLVGPAGMPEQIVDRINVEVAGVLDEPEVVQRIRGIGNNPSPTSPKAFRDRIVADIEKWTETIDSAHIDRI